jgi:hypothetical protein
MRIDHPIQILFAIIGLVAWALQSSNLTAGTETQPAPIFENSSADGNNSSADNNSAANNGNGSASTVYRAPELLAIEQLVLVLSNATSETGDRQEVLVFLGRTNQRGWEAIGTDDIDELRLHWRSVASRLYAGLRADVLSSQQMDKIDLAVEVSIAQFIRLYTDLRNDFLDQPDQRSRLAVLAADNRYEQLRQLGREGLFTDGSLVARVIQNMLCPNCD